MPLQRALSIAQPKNEKTPEKGNQVGLSNEQLKAAVGGLSAETLVEIDQDGDGEVDAHEYAAYMRRAEAERQEIEDLASLLSPEELDMIDTDKDGRVSVEEYRAYLLARGAVTIFMVQAKTRRCARLVWTGTSRAGLARLYLSHFFPQQVHESLDAAVRVGDKRGMNALRRTMSGSHAPNSARPAGRASRMSDDGVKRPSDVRFVLQHPKYGVPFSNFNLSDLKDGSVLTAFEAFSNGSSKFIAAGATKNDMLANNGAATLRERLWVLLDDPLSSRPATVIFLLMMFLIILSTVTFCIDTMPRLYEHDPGVSHPFFVIEATCIACFTFELSTRFWASPDRRAFFADVMNMIDLVAILPFYIELVAKGVEVPGLAVLRVLRLVRVFRLFKMNRGPVQVFASTMSRSARPLYMLTFFVLIALVVFSSLLYYIEGAMWDSGLQTFVRHVSWECTTPFSYDPPLSWARLNASAALRERHSGLGDPCALQPLEEQDLAAAAELADAEGDVGSSDLLLRHALYVCPSTYDKGGCRTVWEVSPFESIPAVMWFSLETMSSLGYGDFGPVSAVGKILTMIIMSSGLLVLSLPISVVGSNFTTVYQYLQMQERREKMQLEARRRNEKDAKQAERRSTARRTKVMNAAKMAIGVTKSEA